MRTKKTPKIKRIVNRVASRLKRLSCVQARKELKKMGYRAVGSGGFKIVYKKKGEPVCVKVYRFSDDWTQDSYRVPKVLRKHYLYPVHKTKVFLIQEWAPKWMDRDVHDEETYAERGVIPLPDKLRGKYDVRDTNIRILNGREVVTDFCADAMQ